ncbi:CDGSH iron-sulfur domain-containing protein 3, mitochondrial-like [Ptychodera flava]|uniref:CDGSH iron-sulfur domain-containing protein 3, mitochondrial-like n=1 Tax=Ptychodera flava TaxID=63121 RepID=UPI003969FC11
MSALSWMVRCPLTTRFFYVVEARTRPQVRRMTTAVIAAKSPFKVTCEADKRYSWCSCGRSKKQPFCDGAHKGTGMRPLRFTLEEAKELLLCGCKQTKNPPYCDGSHKQDFVQNAII